MGSAVKSVTDAVSSPAGLLNGVTAPFTLAANALGGGNLLKGNDNGLGTGRAGLDAAQAQGLQTSTDITNQLNQLQPQQQAFAQQLAAKANGTGPSIADAQLQSAMSRNLQQQMAAAQANRAVNPALANRQLSNNAAQVQRDTANAGVTARLQEQQQNQQQFQSYIQGQQGASANFLGAGSQAAAQNAQAQMGQQQMQNGILGGVLNAGASIGAAFLADGGTVPDLSQLQKFEGSALIKAPDMGAGMSQTGSDAGSTFGKALKALMQPGAEQGTMMAGGPMDNMGGAPAMPGMDSTDTMMAAKGGKVPGKAEVSGDSKQNDKVPAMLSPGEVVVPRSVIAMGHEAAGKFAAEAAKKGNGFDAKAFAAELQKAGSKKMSDGGKVAKMANGGVVEAEKSVDPKASKKPDAGYGAVLAAHKELSARLEKLESKMGKKSDAKKDK